MVGTTLYHLQSQQTMNEVISLQQTIYNHSPLGIVYIDNMHIISANPYIEKIFGWSIDEILQGAIDRYFHSPISLYEMSKTSQPLTNNGKSFSTEIQCKSKNGQQIWCHLSGQQVTTTDKSERSLWVVTDISAMVEMEDALMQAKEQAMFHSQAKGEFLAKMSHEIRTPLNGILGMVNLLGFGNLDSEQRHKIEVMQRSGETLLTIINDILDFSKIAAGQLQLVEAPFKIEPLLSDIQTLFKAKAEEKVINLLLQIDHNISPLVLLGDSNRLNQIIYNLVSNAIKFTHIGHVDIECRLLDQTKEYSSLQFSIEDSGVGIPADKQESLFTAFYQAHHHDNWQNSGTGLGLAISQSLLEKMESSLKFASHEGKGTRFYFDIKLENASENELILNDNTQIDPSDIGHIPQFKAEILIAEDNPVNQEVAKGYLQLFGCHVTFANNGREAVNYYTHGAYDLILMDLSMPVLDGLSASREIRALEQNKPQTPTVPIIAMTAHTQSSISADLDEAAMNGYLSKPFTLQQLQPILLNHLTPVTDIANNPDQQVLPPPLDKSIIDKPNHDTKINMAAIETLQQLEKESAGILQRIIDLYQKSAPELLQTMAEDANNMNNGCIEIRKAAHALKSSSATVGAEQIADISQEIEVQAKKGVILHDHIGQLKSSLPLIMQRLTEVVTQHNS